jgi:hypothetical protein
MMSGQARHPLQITKRQILRDLSVPCLYVKRTIADRARLPRTAPNTGQDSKLAGALRVPSFIAPNDQTVIT